MRAVGLTRPALAAPPHHQGRRRRHKHHGHRLRHLRHRLRPCRCLHTATCHHSRGSHHCLRATTPSPQVPSLPSDLTPWLPNPPLPSPPAVCCSSTRSEMEQPSSIRTSRMPALSPMLDRLLRAQTLCLLCGSSGAIPVALVGLARGRSVGQRDGRRTPTCCVHAAAARAHAHTSQSRDPVPLTVILRFLSPRARRVW